MIEPSIGRKVWFHPNGRAVPALSCYGDQPMDATVIFVHGPRMVNLAVIDHNGLFFSLTSIRLLQDDDQVPENGMAYAEWMPFQKGQAAKEETKVAVCGESLSMIPRMEPFQMAQSLAWAAKDLLATPCIGSELKAKADGAAMRALERMEGLLGIDGLPEVDLEDEPLEVVRVPAKDSAADRITLGHIESRIVATLYQVLPGTTVTVCCLELLNGRKVVGINYGPVNPANFNEVEGRQRARAEAVDKLWELEGYLLAQRLYEAEQAPAKCAGHEGCHCKEPKPALASSAK